MDRFLIGALSAAVLGGIVLLIRQTIRGIKRTATKRSVIICTAIHGVLGLFFAVMGAIGFPTTGIYFFVGLAMLGAGTALVMNNFVKKKDESGSDQTEHTD